MPMPSLFQLCILLSCCVCVNSQPTYDVYKQGKANASAAAATAAAKESKMAAVSKVVSLLEGLKAKVLEEGESEAKTYNKFACFCKDTTSEKTAAIETGTDTKAGHSASIETLSAERSQLDSNIQTLTEEIAAAEASMKSADAQRAAELKQYETDAADLAGAIAALRDAIQALKASKSLSMLQLQAASETLQMAIAMADALGLDGSAVRKATTSLLQQDSTAPTVEMEDYKFHSDSIVETLEKLLVDFQEEKADVDAAEVHAVQAHEAFMQEKTDLVKNKNAELESSNKLKAQKQEAIASTSTQLSTVAATLLDDKQYLAELSKMCSDKALTWDARSKVRQDELSALTSAIAIIQGAVSEKTTAATMRFAQKGVQVRLAEAVARTPVLMEALEAEAESTEGGSAPSFLQMQRVKAFLAPIAETSGRGGGDGRQALVSLFRSRGQALKSEALTSLASRIAEDPFAKVKTLIQELIERLLKEASNEANQKSWCDKSISDAEQKRGYAAEQVEELNSNMAGLEAKRDKLEEELKVLMQEISDLESSRTEAVKLRSEEKTENVLTVQEATDGFNAVNEAITILDQFYKTVAKSTVDLSLLEQGPDADAPYAGFGAGEAYTGAQATAGGIIGMLQVIKGDFTRTITETEKAEAEAEQDHLAFMTDTGKSLAAKGVAKGEKTTQKDDTESELDTATDSLHSQMAILTTSVKEFLELKPACIDTDMSYQERISRRQEEIDALKKGLCILESYSQYGPQGGVDNC